MRFRPCIDLHNGRVKQIVGSTLRDGGEVTENFVSDRGASFYARLFREKGFSGGHIILLDPARSAYYEKDTEQAVTALAEAPGQWQVGGGITPENASFFLDRGASHVIVTSYVFNNGRIDEANLQRMTRAVGREHLVLDLSCKRIDGRYLIVTDRWQHTTNVVLNAQTLLRLADSCAEFLIHAADAEGKQDGIETPLLTLLGNHATLPVTYAGGIRSHADIDLIGVLGRGLVDYTVGSALEIFGGELMLDDLPQEPRGGHL